MPDSFHLLLAQADAPDADLGDIPPAGNGALPASPGQTTGQNAAQNTAQTATQGTTGTTGTTGRSGGMGDILGGMGLPLIFLAVIVVFWFMMTRNQKKEKARREEMLSAITKGKRVVTIGGIVGVVTEVSEHEVRLKVDENSNTHMRFSRKAIQSVLGDDDEVGSA